MTLKVDLLGDNAACIKLVQVNDIYTKRRTLLQGGGSIITDNGWMFFVGLDFSINKRTKIIIIPQNPNKHEDTIYFSSNENRKEILKDIHTALLHWSCDKSFKYDTAFDKNPNIKFHKNIWIIF